MLGLFSGHDVWIWYSLDATRKMSYLLHFGDLLLDGKEPVDDSVDKIVSALRLYFKAYIDTLESSCQLIV